VVAKCRCASTGGCWWQALMGDQQRHAGMLGVRHRHPLAAADKGYYQLVTD
jgi:hypothetical protein